MNSLQLKIKKSFLAKLKSSEYKTIPNPCLCGNKKGHIVAGHDRYGITLITKFCLNCGLVRSDPYYTQKTLNQFYQQEYPVNGLRLQLLQLRLDRGHSIFPWQHLECRR